VSALSAHLIGGRGKSFPIGKIMLSPKGEVPALSAMAFILIVAEERGKRKV